MHGGSEKIPNTQEERRESKVGMPGGQEHGAEPKGTGEQHVKTTGLKTDGGDFDASKPGAGREADRTLPKAAVTVGRVLSRADMMAGLLEEKGVHRDEKGNMEGGSPASPGSPGKVSKMEKLKEKLHIKHKDK